jgi:hypothetical protein
VLVRAFVQESRDPTPRGPDLPGQVLFIVGVGALTYALIEGPHSGWLSPLILGLLIGSAAIAVAFVLTELRARDPMMDVRVFRDRVYSVAIIILFSALFAVYGLLLVITQYFQTVEDYSPELAGVLMLAFTAPTIVLAPIAGGIAARMGGRLPSLVGLLSLLVGLTVVGLGIGTLIVVVLVGLFFVGAGAGLALTPTTNVAMSSIPAERSGMASGIMSAQRALGSTAGFAIMGSVLAAVVAATLPAKFSPYLTEPQLSEAVDVVVEDANPRAVVSIMGPGQPLPESVTEQDELVDAADESFSEGIRVAIAVGGVVVLLALIAGYVVLPKATKEEADEEGEAAGLAREEGS